MRWRTRDGAAAAENELAVLMERRQRVSRQIHSSILNRRARDLARHLSRSKAASVRKRRRPENGTCSRRSPGFISPELGECEPARHFHRVFVLAPTWRRRQRRRGLRSQPRLSTWSCDSSPHLLQHVQRCLSRVVNRVAAICYFATVRSFCTSKTPLTPRARTSAIWRSAALSTTPRSIVRPFLTMM